jgi:hypothetical protein
LQKSPQTIENKGDHCEKERQERTRVFKLLTAIELQEAASGEGRGDETLPIKREQVETERMANGSMDKLKP